MKIKFNPVLGSICLTITSLSLILPAKGDTVNARCDVYLKGEDRATSSSPCTFSQRQGAVSIQLQNGRRYDLRPVGNQPGNYRDQNGQPAYRQSGLDDRGQIYRLANESIYVYWNQDSNNNNESNQPTSGSSSVIPVTKMTRQNANRYAVLITEGEFNFSGVLNRTSGNTFIGSDERVRVIYNRSNGQITIINVATGAEFYNYIYSDVNEGSL